jgi:T5SS/PEP-CTERM-associated repeat protein
MCAQRKFVRCIALVVACLGMTDETAGATITWNGLSGGNYDNTINWSGLTVPIAIDDAVFPLMGLIDNIEFFSSPTIASVQVSGDYLFEPRSADRSYTVTGNLDILSGGDITIIEEGGAGTSSLTFDVGGATTVNAGGELSASDGTFSTLSLMSNGLIDFTGTSSIEVTGVGNHDIGTAGNTATIHMHGGSAASFAGTLRLGFDSTAGSQADMTIHVGSTATLANLVIGGGSGAGSSGSLDISDSGSSTIMTGGSTLSIGGSSGAGSLSITDNASFTTGTGLITVGTNGTIDVNTGASLTLRGDLTLPNITPLTNDGGTVIVNNSTTSVQGSVSFGHTSGTTFEVLNGGELSYQYGWFIGRSAGELGTTIVSGVNGPNRSRLTATGGGGGADVVVGYDGSGQLDVLDGGLVTAGDDLYVGRNTGSAGVLNVDSVNGSIRSTVDVTRNNSVNSNIYVGSGQSSTAGVGEMNITNGALVQTSGSVTVGQVAGSDGLVTINGDGGGFDSELIAANDIIIGGTEGAAGGTGTISGLNGALTAGDMIRIWPNGTLSTLGTHVTAPLVEVNGGVFSYGGGDTGGDMSVINGGTLSADSLTLIDSVMTVTDPGSLAVVVSTFRPVNGSIVDVTNGGLLQVRAIEMGGFASGADVTIDNATMQEITPSGSPALIKEMKLVGASPATLTFQNNAIGDFNDNTQFIIGEVGPNNGTDSVNVLSGSDVTIGKIVMGNIISSVNVDGPGSTLTLVNALDGESLDMSAGGAINVSGSGELNLGTGDARAYNVTLTTSGILTRPSTTTPFYFWGNNDVTGGVFNADGHIEIDNLGTLTADSASLQLGAGERVTLSSTSTLNLQDAYAFDDNNTLRVDGLFSVLNAASDLSFTSGSHLRVSAGTNTLSDTLTIGTTGVLSMSPGTGGPAMLTVNNLDLQAGSTINLHSGTLEIDGVLTNGNNDLLLNTSSIHNATMRLNPGSSAAVTGAVVIGSSSSRTLEVISNCCQATTLDSDDLILGETPGTYGSALISGNQASVTLSNSLYVGSHRLGAPAGTGSLTVESGADVVVDNFLKVGAYGTGTMDIDNGASVVVGHANVGVGSGGDGTLNISGGVLQTIGLPFPSPIFGDLYVGSIGTGLIDGTGGLIDISNELIVGNDGGGGTVDLENTDLDAYAVRVGTGLTGVGLFKLGNGSQANITGSVVLGETADTSGTLNVTPSSGTAADLSVGTELIIGGAGDGTFTAGYGSDVISPVVKIAEQVSSTGSASITGTSSDSNWDGDTLFIGGGGTGAGGTGSMIVGNGGNLNFTNTIRVWSTGSLHIGGGTVTTGVLSRFDIPQEGALNWTSGDLTLTNSDLSVGTGTTINFFLGDNFTLPHSGVLTISGEAVIGDPVTTGPGTLVIRDRMVTGSFERTLVGAAGSLTLDSATLDTNLLELRAGAVLVGEGTVDGRVLALAGSAITINGNLTLGDASRFDGVVIDTNLQIAGNILTLNSAGFAALGPVTTVSGGELRAPSGIALDPGDVISGSGTIIAEVAAAAGSIINVDGNLILGDSTAFDGFVSDGRLDVNNFSATLRDANEAILPSLVTLGASGVPGTLRTDNGAVLEFGKAMTGYGTVGLNTIGLDDPTKPFVNNGTIQGNSAGQPIIMEGFVKGVGTFDHVVFTGTFSPGLSPTVISAGDVSYAGTLEIELGGTTPGTEHDQINHSGTATLGGILDLSLINGFIPGAGDSFDILDWGSITGNFSALNLPTLGGGLDWDTSNLLIDGTLSVFSNLLAGDLNADGFVGIADLNIVLGVWNTNVTPGDLLAGDPSGDGFVGIADLNAVLGNWNAGTPPGETANIPEPTSAALLTLSIMCLLRSRSA